MMKHITIGNLPNLTVKEFGSLYLSSFGTIWLALEPLEAFGLYANFLSNLGWLGYIFLFLASFIISLSISKVWRNIKFKQQEFISFIVESSIENNTYEVKVPALLQVWSFMHLFIEHLEKGKNSEKVKAIKRLHTPVLNMKRGKIKMILDNSTTIKEIGIIEDDMFFITGKPIEIDMTPRFSRCID